MLAPVQRKNLSEQVFGQIRDEILAGRFVPGERLPAERVLCETMSVNRSSVREALKRLEQARLIEVRHGEGSVVLDFRITAGIELLADLVASSRTPARTGLRSVLEFRSLIMPEVARLAALRIDASELEGVDALVEALEACDIDDVGRFQELDFEFHHALARAGDNLAFLLILNSVRNIYHRVRDEFAAMFANAPTGSRRLYRKIAVALRDGKAATAERLCRKLIDDGNAALWGPGASDLPARRKASS
jgi:GntR family transcriptional regulator, transcriptional repressor for pyruvate dehydrogenase complex